MAQKKPIKPGGNAKKTKLLADQGVALADYAAKAYTAACELQIKAKPVMQFPLDTDERATVAEIPALPAKLKKKLAKEGSSYSIVDVAGMGGMGWDGTGGRPAGPLLPNPSR
jgi:hypothetical protein